MNFPFVQTGLAEATCSRFSLDLTPDCSNVLIEQFFKVSLSWKAMGIRENDSYNTQPGGDDE